MIVVAKPSLSGVEIIGMKNPFQFWLMLGAFETGRRFPPPGFDDCVCGAPR
jgi:hypothetical protein